MNAPTASAGHAHSDRLAHAAASPLEVVCSWCRETVCRKPVSGARLSHTICRPCAQQFLAQAELERNSRWV